MAGTRRSKKAARDAGVQWMSDIQEERLEWLWEGYIPRGKIIVLDGDPGLGKSTLAFDLLARLSCGGEMPDGQPIGKPRACLVVSGEDDLADTVRPRLRAAGADLDRVGTIALRHDDLGRPIPFSVPEDVERLKKAISAAGAEFVVIDPIMAFFGEKIQTGNDASVRKAMSPLTDLASSSRASLLLLRHLNKDVQQAKAMYRGGGSIAIAAAARSVLIVGSEPGGSGWRGLAQTKNNLSKAAKSLRYRVVGWEDDPEIATIEWGGASEVTADELVAVSDGRRDGKEKQVAVRFLRETLRSGPMDARRVQARAAKQGISESTLKRARKSVDVHSVRRRGKDGTTERWSWHLPSDMDPNCPRCNG